jgi:quercetin dioxygenase-like cupin family protein
MKMLNRMIVVLSAVAVMASLGIANAADPLVAGPGMYKLLMENDRVRVMEVTFQPGQKIAEHTHPDHFVYVVEGGTLKISKPDGSSSDAVVKAGDVLWIPAETHWATNTGTTKVRLVVNELKEPAPMKKDAMEGMMKDNKKPKK